MTRTRTRVAFATPGALDGGGIGRMTDYIVDQLHTRGRRTGSGPDTVVLDTRGRGSVFLSPFYLAAALVRLLRMQAQGEVDAVHINVSERASFLRKAAIQAAAGVFGTPTVVHLHGASFVDYFRGGPFARVISRWLFRRCSRAIVLGHSWRDFLVEEVGIDPGKVDVLYNAVPDFAGPDIERTPPPAGEPVRLLVLAHLSERKGIGTLLQACALLRERGFAFRLTLGGNGEVDNYRRMAGELGIGDACGFLGWVTREQAHELIRSHHVLLLPSTHEGLPMVILEALCARLPVITTPVGSIPEVLDHRETALIVPVGEREGLADAVQALASDPDLYRAVGEAGRRLFEEQFNIEGYCERLCAVYDALGRPGPRRPRRIPDGEPAPVLADSRPPAEASLPRVGRR
ncbi:MAG TPA: glycosyltransferase family 4 protein [Azospirillum sp.]|nr:glycosyltransferase family 4 protein [Azospirillum sp.]